MLIPTILCVTHHRRLSSSATATPPIRLARLTHGNLHVALAVGVHLCALIRLGNCLAFTVTIEGTQVLLEIVSFLPKLLLLPRIRSRSL